MKKLEEFSNCLSEYCFPLYQRLQPPLNEDEIEFFFEKWGIKDLSLKEIFLWRNGVPYDESLPTFSFDFTGFGVIPTLTKIDEIITIEATQPYWKNSLFPLVTSFAGDFLLYETDKEVDNYGQLYLYSPNLGYVDYQVSYFDSVESMFDTIIDCFEKGAFAYDYKAMSLDIDFPLRSEIALKLNPKSEYWQ